MIEPFKDYGDFVNHKNERIICFNVSRTYLGCERPNLYEWYLNDWKRTKELSDNCTVNLKLKWLKGEGESETPLHSAYVCSLDHDSENCWQKLWE